MEDFLDEDVLDIEPEYSIPQPGVEDDLIEETPVQDALQEQSELQPDGPLNGEYGDEVIDLPQTASEVNNPLADTADYKRASMEQKSEEKRARLSQKFEQPQDLLESTQDYERGLIGDIAANEIAYDATDEGAAQAEMAYAQSMSNDAAQEQALDDEQYDENIVGWGLDKAVTGVGDAVEYVAGEDLTNVVRGAGNMTTDLVGWVMEAPKNLADITGVDKENLGYELLEGLSEGGEAISKIDFGFDSSGLELEGKAAKDNFMAALENGEGYGQATLDAVGTIGLQSVMEGVGQALPYGMALGAKLAVSAPVFFGSVMDMSAEDIKGRQLNKPGEEITAKERASIVAVNTALMMIEKLAFDKIMGGKAKRDLMAMMGKNLSTAEKAALKARIDSPDALTDPGLLTGGLKSAAATAGRGIAAGTVEETGQETLQALGSTYNQKFGTKAMDGANLSDKDLASVVYQGAFGGLTGTGMSATMGQYHEQRKNIYERNMEHGFKQRVYSERAAKDRIEANSPTIQANYDNKEAQYEVADDLLSKGDITQLDDGQEVITIDVTGTDKTVTYPVTKMGDSYYMNVHDMETFFPEDSKEQISEQMSTLIDDAENTFVDDNSVVVDGQKWKKNPDYKADGGVGYIDDAGEFVENEQWIQASGKETRGDNELNFAGKTQVDNQVNKLNQEADAQIETETKADVKEEKKLTKEKTKLEKMRDTILDTFEAKKAKAEASVDSYQGKINGQISKREAEQKILDKLASEPKTVKNKKRVKEARENIAFIGKQISKLESKQEANDKAVDQTIKTLVAEKDKRVATLDTKISERDNALKETQARIAETTEGINVDTDAAIAELDYRGGTGKTKVKKKTKFRDGLADIFIEALQAKRDKPLTPKQIAAARGQATRVLKSKNDSEVKQEYVKALKTIHDAKPSTQKKKVEAEDKKTKEANKKSGKFNKEAPADMNERIEKLDKYDEKKLQSIIEDLIEEIDEIMEKC